MKNEKNINISERVLDQIKKEDVKIRSKWVFVAEKLGMESGVLLSIIIGIVLLCFMLYVMEKNGAFEFTEFGPNGWMILFGNIPYDLVIIAVVFFVISNYLIGQFDFSYKRPFYLISCGVIIIIFGIGISLMWTGASHAIFDRLSGNKLAQGIYDKKITQTPKSGNAIIGKVINIGSESMMILTPQGKIIKVNFTPKIVHPMDLKFTNGQIVKIIGTKNGEIFRAQIIRTVKPDQSRYFRDNPIPNSVMNSN